MTLRGLSLQHFRLHANRTFQFHPAVTLIIGANASGKTSILEAAHLLATGKSFRASRVAEMVGFSQELSRVKGLAEYQLSVTGMSEDDIGSALDPERAAAAEKLSQANETAELEVLLTRGQVGGQRAAHRLFSVNGVRRQQRTATGILKTVLFRPEDMRLIEGSPSRRREYLDTPLALLFPEYFQALRAYEQVLKRRNRLLSQVREGEQPQTALSYWNQGMLKHGQVLQRFRKRFTASAPQVSLKFPLQLHYQPSVMSQERASQYLSREIAAGHSLIGPHKDDLQVHFAPKGQDEQLDIALYGSRGQQRLAVLWLKLVELSYLTQESGERPVLLLDDIFSELDSDSHKIVLDQLQEGQTIITTTDPSLEQQLQSALSAERIKTLRL